MYFDFCVTELLKMPTNSWHFLSTESDPVLVLPGYQTGGGGGYKQQKCISHRPGPWKSRSKAPSGLVSSHGGRVKELSGAFCLEY